MTMPKKPDGFALPIVFLVLLLLAVAFVGLADTVVVGSTAAGSRIDRQKKFYACEGVVRLASGIARDTVLDDPLADFVDLNSRLAVVRDIAIQNGIDVSAPVRATESVRILDDGPLAGLEVIGSGARFAVSADPSVGCSLNLNQPTGSVSPLQFLAFSVEGGSIQAGITPLSPADPAFVWGRAYVTVPRLPGGDEITSVTEAEAALRLPAPAEGEPPGSRFTITRARTFLPYLQPPFTNNPSRTEERPSARIAYLADIRIVDGEWYVRDPAVPSAWPGRPLFGDHPCDDDATPAKTCAATYLSTSAGSPSFYTGPATKKRLYSVYERISTGLLDDVERGVVSYGRILDNQAAVSASASLCNVPPLGALRRQDQCPLGDRKKILLEAARTPMADANGNAILPINIDVGMLGQALATVVNGEIGSMVCAPGVVGCLRPFNGIVYVTSTHGVSPTLVPGAMPYALCGGAGSLDNGVNPGIATQDCASAVKYNAVRVFDAADLTAFAATGLTIATDLPLFTYGDWNKMGTAGGRTLLMGDRLTVLSDQWKDDGSVAIGGRVTLNASVIAGWGPVSARKLSDVLRTVEDQVDLRVGGAVVAGHDAVRPLSAGKPLRSLAWIYPPDLVHPQVEFQPPGVPRVGLGLPLDIAPGITVGGCGGGA